ncbi:MAG: glycosyltransferase family 39 protein, partial [Bacteroidota bacterium]|nr:glycosyltransferase family 39 protein [Bacteroidota bacterium]
MNSLFAIPRLKLISLVSIPLISILMHFNHFNKELIGIHVWRQTQTQSTINNFYEEDFNILNPSKNERRDGDGIFRMEFPLMQWLVASVYKVFGAHILITRIFMFMVGLLSVWGVYRLLRNFFQNEHAALAGAWAFNFSPCFYFYTINPLPDNLALCTGIWGLAFFFTWLRFRNDSLLWLCGIMFSIATLCKLPFILYYIVPAAWFFMKLLEQKSLQKILIPCFKIFCFIILPLLWYVWVIPGWQGNGIVNGMFENDFSAPVIIDYLQHNLVSTLPELLVNYAAMPFFIAGFYFIWKNKAYQNPLFNVIILLCLGLLAYFFFELNMIAKVHDYYLFPFYPVIFMVVTYGLWQLYELKYKYNKTIVLFLLAMLPLTAYLRMHKRWDLNSPGFNKDLLMYKNELRKA